MNKHCGQTKFLFSLLVAALFCLTLAAPESSAQQVKIGAGVDDPCYNGTGTTPATSNGGSWCGILGGSVNVVLDNSFNWYQNTTNNTNIVSPLVLGFAVPVQNLLKPFEDVFGPQPEFNGPVTSTALTNPAEFVDSSQLPCWFDCSGVLGDGPNVDVSFPSSPVNLDFSAYLGAGSDTYPFGWPPAGFTQGTVFALGETGHDGAAAVGNTDVYEFIGLPACDGGNPFCGPQSNHINNWTNASTEIPAMVLGIPEDQFLVPTEGWKLYLFTLNEHDLIEQKDAIHLFFDEAQLPIGTFVFAWAIGARGCDEGTTQNCDPNYFTMSFTETAMLMPLPDGGEIPEPTSLLLLGTGLLAVGKKLRKRQKEQGQKIL